VKSPRGSGI